MSAIWSEELDGNEYLKTCFITQMSTLFNQMLLNLIHFNISVLIALVVATLDG
jgi:hypothetical protein